VVCRGFSPKSPWVVCRGRAPRCPAGTLVAIAQGCARLLLHHQVCKLQLELDCICDWHDWEAPLQVLAHPDCTVRGPGGCAVCRGHINALTSYGPLSAVCPQVAIVLFDASLLIKAEG
jgi:hypothetical protein